MADKTNEGVVIYIATYASLDDAKTDYEAVKQLHSAGVIGTYDAAAVSYTHLIVHPSRPSRHRENDLPSGALPTICHPHQYSPKLPHLSPTFATPLLTPTSL